MTRRLDDSVLWERIDRSGGPDACWPWHGRALRNGRGLWRGTTATRELMRRAGHTIAKNQYVCHRCDNPPCCNPAHLYVGDAKTNAADALNRGRTPTGASHWTRRVPGAQRGSRNNCSKLTEGDIVAIRRRRADGDLLTVLAADFGLHVNTVYRIAKRMAWSHVQ